MSEKSVKNDDFGPQKIPPNCAFDPDRWRHLPWNRPWYLALGPVFLRRIWNQVANASRADGQVRAICKKKSEKIVKMTAKNVHSKGCKKRRFPEAQECFAARVLSSGAVFWHLQPLRPDRQCRVVPGTVLESRSETVSWLTSAHANRNGFSEFARGKQK